MKLKLFVCSCLLCLLFSVTGEVNASRVSINTGEELTLDFRGSRIRVESWNRNYVDIDTTYLVKNSYNIKKDNNIISFDKEEHLEKYPKDLDNNTLGSILNEVYFIVKVPAGVPINIYAESVNIKDGCQLQSIIARYARVRDSRFLNDFKGKGERIYIRESRFEGKKNLDYDKITNDRNNRFWRYLINIIF